MQAVPLYLSEIALAHARGTLNVMFQMATTIGIWVAQWINYGTQNMHPHGWRLSVGLAIVPALILFLGSLIIPDTPNSLVQRGKIEQARRTLERVRGTPNVDAEFTDIVEAVDASRSVNKMAILQKKYRPILVSLPMVLHCPGALPVVLPCLVLPCVHEYSSPMCIALCWCCSHLSKVIFPRCGLRTFC